MDVTGNPLIILASDVAGLTSASPNTITISGTTYLIVWKGNAHVYQVEFMQYASTASTCNIDRYNGLATVPKDFWDGHGAGDLTTVRSGNLGWAIQGLVIPNNGITDGLVKIYIK